jgi:dihydrofolate reductase
MRKLVYDVAASVDGFIAGPEDNIEGFQSEGEHVRDYFERLQRYDTVVMGRKTYESGYSFGLKPGKRAYPHMRHYIFSKSIPLESNDQIEIVRSNWLETIASLKKEAGSDIYLCGGGNFAGHLLEHQLIDTLIVKVNPILLGDGIRLFHTPYKLYRCHRTTEKLYGNGIRLDIYDLEYNT